MAGMAMQAAGMEEAVIRAAQAGMALVQVGITLALAGMGVAVTGTVVTGVAGVVAGIMVVMVAVGEWPRDRSRCWPWTTRGSASNGSLLQWLRLRVWLRPLFCDARTLRLVLVRPLSRILPCGTPMPGSVATRCSVTK